MKKLVLASATAIAIGFAACDSEPTLSPTPVLTTIDVALGASEIEVGQVIKVSATPLDQHGESIAAGTPVFSSSDPRIAEVDPRTGDILGISSGTAHIIATVGARSGGRAVTVAFPAAIRINEIRSNDDGPGGWVELYNPTGQTVDLSGWMVANEHVNHVAALSAGTTIPAKGYLVLDESVFPLGISRLGGAHLFSRFSVIVDDPFWSSPIETTIGRCPNGQGELVPLATATKAAANACAKSQAR